jgi:hypothetical protein
MAKMNGKEISDELQDLLNHQKEIADWKLAVKYRIHELETSYLDEPNSLGNIIKGWDPDGRLGPIKKQPTEDKDRLFSNSSYQVWLEMKAQQDLEAEKKQAIIKSEPTPAQSLKLQPKLKKQKRMSNSIFIPEAEAEQYGDY